MELLEQRILTDGKVLPGGILKVDGFLNHQIDPQLLYEMALEFKRLYDGAGINKILTIEASGIGIACIVASCFHVPVVFAKKSKSVNIDGAVYVAEVESFTHKCKNQVIVSKKFLKEGEHVLLIDDFLANGKALEGLAQLVQDSGAELVGAGVVIEKGFQRGGDVIRAKGIHLESLAIVDGMNDKTGEIIFRELSETRTEPGAESGEFLCERGEKAAV